MTEPKRGIVLAEVVASGLALGLSVLERFLSASLERVRDIKPKQWETERVEREIEERMKREKTAVKTEPPI